MNSKKLFQICLSIAISFFMVLVASYIVCSHNVSIGIMNTKTLMLICLCSWILSFIASIFFGIKAFFGSVFLSKIQKQANKEKWGEFEKSTSGVEWYFGRLQNWYVPNKNNPDSRELLEKLGFRILGIADEMRYCVEPPEGYRMESNGDWWFKIYNHANKLILNVFEKQNDNELKCFVSLPH